jgi:hypothetical protein
MKIQWRRQSFSRTKKQNREVSKRLSISFAILLFTGINGGRRRLRL